MIDHATVESVFESGSVERSDFQLSIETMEENAILRDQAFVERFWKEIECR
jgi:hypothetical protein